MGIQYPPLATSAATLPSAITPGASPYTYQNTDSNPISVLVSAGTVTTIAFSRDNTTYYTVGIIAGMFMLNAGDYLKVTYAVAPTMTKIPR